MVITTLIENTRLKNRPDLHAEHGLSLHIRYHDRQLLFDTGASSAFSDNANVLGINLDQVSQVVLSHHHYDHGGGLPYFFERNRHAGVYLCPPPDGECCGGAFGVVTRYIGLKATLFEEYPDRFEYVAGVMEIVPDVFIITDMGSRYPRPRGNRFLYLKKKRTTVHDPFEHELMVVIRIGGELVVITGCSHNGTLNMVETATRHFPGMPIKALIGGFHLVEMPVIGTTVESAKEIENIALTLRTYPLVKVYTGHCTCDKAFAVLKKIMGDQIEHLVSGGRIEI